MKTIAILIPVRNAAHCIKTAIESVYKQTIFISKQWDFRIILVDNNSIDNLKDVISVYDKITYLFCSIPGVVPTRNTAVHHILNNENYEYIAMIDADDEWFPEKLEKQLPFLIEHDVCGTGMRFFKGEKSFNVVYPQTNENIRESFIKGNNPFGNSSVILKSKVFKICGGYDLTYKYCEDLDFFLRAYPYFKMYNVPEILVNYNFNDKSENYLQEQQMNANLIYLRTLTLTNK
jgi:glycosyltransferase involved in cell wall biosynthesis